MREGIYIKILLVFSVVVFFSFGVYHLTKFETVDEHFWKYERIHQYWDSIAERNWKKTYVNDKPGITVALISGIGLLFEPDPQNHRIRDVEINRNNLLTLYDINRTEKINLALRLPILIFNGLSLFFFFWIIRKITENDRIALLTIMFMGLSPIIIGISQIINPDSLLWTFSAAGIFSFFALIKTKEKKFIFLVIAFTGLSLLSKYTANILFHFYLSIIFLNYLVNFHKIVVSESLKKYFLREFLNYFYVIFGSLALYSILLPAVFIKFKYFYRGTIGFPGFKMFIIPFLVLIASVLADLFLNNGKVINSIGIFLNKHKKRIVKILSLIIILIFLAVIFNCLLGQKIIPFDELQKTSYLNKSARIDSLLPGDNQFVRFSKIFLLETYPFVFSLHPIIIAALLLSWLKMTAGDSDNFQLYKLFILIIFPFYFIANMASDVLANIRYSIILYPLFYFLAALGIIELIGSLNLKNKFNKYLLPGLIFVIFISGIYSLFKIKPFYFNYSNFLLPNKFSSVDAWGYGEYEAAQYLNSLPNSENLNIWSDRSAICQFIKGKCINDYKIDLSKIKPDYFVISQRGVMRYQFVWKFPDLAENASSYYYKKSDNDFAWLIFIDNRPSNFVKVIKSEE